MGQGLTVTEELRLARLGVLCAEAPDIGALEPDHEGRPSEGSDAAADSAQTAEPERFAWVTLLPRLWISAATENLWGVAAILNTPVINHPPRSLLRATLEHTSRAWWVLAGADADKRAARAWLARWDGVRREADIAKKDAGRTGAMQWAPDRLANIETRIDEVFGETPTVGKRPWEHSLCGETIGSNTQLVADVARGTLGEDVPVDALYGTHSLLLHPSTTAVIAFAESDGKRITLPRTNVGHLVGSALTILGIWRGTFQRVLAFHGWEHPDLPEWSEALDAAVVAHNRAYPSSGTEPEPDAPDESADRFWWSRAGPPPHPSTSRTGRMMRARVHGGWTLRIPPPAPT